MIHIFGMSHAVSALEAYCGGSVPVDHSNFCVIENDKPEFYPIQANVSNSASSELRAYLAPTKHGWGAMAWLNRRAAMFSLLQLLGNAVGTAH